MCKDNGDHKCVCKNTMVTMSLCKNTIVIIKVCENNTMTFIKLCYIYNDNHKSVWNIQWQSQTCVQKYNDNHKSVCHKICQS